MELHLTLTGRRGLADQIYQQIRDAVLAGALPAGRQLPSSRELAGQLEVSRNTVLTAYDRLVGEGFVTGRAGRGMIVSGQLAAVGPAPPSGVLRPRPGWEEFPEPFDLSGAYTFDFRPGLPDAAAFPYSTWRALLASELRERVVGAGAYADPAGHPGLRAAIARHVRVARGVTTDAAGVVVTTGAQQAMDLLGRVLVGPGETVAVEDPGWLPPRRAFAATGARVVGVDVDSEGLVVERLPAEARLVYVSPSHQFPLGVAMSLRRRLALLAWAERTGAAILEDDYDSEFRYVGRPIEPLHRLDRNGRVVYIGSFSKTLLPGLRIGFCLCPPSLVRAVRQAKFLTDWHSPLPIQAALARFIDGGGLARHVRRMRRRYQERRDRLLEVIEGELSEVLTPLSAAAGLHLTARLNDPAVVDGSVVRRAAEVGVGVVELSLFRFEDVAPGGLVFGYGAIPVERIEAGLRRLRPCLTP